MLKRIWAETGPTETTITSFAFSFNALTNTSGACGLPLTTHVLGLTRSLPWPLSYTLYVNTLNSMYPRDYQETLLRVRKAVSTSQSSSCQELFDELLRLLPQLFRQRVVLAEGT